MAATTQRAQLDIVRICQALGDPTRFAIVRQLDRDGPTACGAFTLDCPPATRSHHFNVLRAAGIIRTEAAGTRRINVLNREELDAAFPGLLASLLNHRSTRRPSRPRTRGATR